MISPHPLPARAAVAVLLAGLAWIAPPAAQGADWEDLPHFEASADQLLAAATSAADVEGDVVILLEDVSYNWDPEGRVHSTFHQVYLVRTKAALEGWGLTEAQWSPWHQARPEIRARVIGPSGTEHWLDPTSVAEAAVAQLDPTMFDDDRLLRAPLPGMTTGAVVEEQIVYQDLEPFFAGGGVTRIPVGEFVPVLTSRIHLEAPTSLELRWRTDGIEPRVKKRRSRSVERVELEFTDLQPLSDLESFLPPDRMPLPYVEFSTARSWGDVARRYHTLFGETLSDEGLEPLVEHVLAGPQEREGQVRAALAAVRERVRYTAVEFGQQSIVPYPTTETLARGYGDCKDQAALLVAVLRAAGIEADVALLRAGPGPDINADMPGLELFDHAIVRVAGDPEIWIDPTAQFTPAGELPLGDQGRLALLARTDVTGVVRTPQPPSSATLYREVREITLPVEGPARIIEDTSARGWIGDSLRYSFADGDDDAIGSHLDEYAWEMYSADGLDAWEIDRGDEGAGGPFRIRLDLSGALTSYATGAEASSSLNPLVVLTWLPQPVTLLPSEGGGALDTREHPLAVPRHRAELVVHIAAAAGYQLQALPDGRTVRCGPAVLEETYTILKGGTVEATYVVDTGEGVLTPAEAEELRRAVNDLELRAPIALIFHQEGEVHLAHGRIAEAIAAYDALIETHPEEGLYRSLRGAAMLPASFGEAARAEARRAVEMDPESPSAWRYLAYVLMHDIYGRELQWPFDRSGAIGALERALALDPDDLLASQNLALVLEHDERGWRHGRNADLQRAAQLYRDIRARHPAPDLDLRLGFVLYHAGEHAELQALTREMQPGMARDALRFASIALSDGPDQVIVEANRQAMGGATKGAELQEAGRLLLQTRHYAEAAALLRGAAKDSTNPVALRQQASRIEQIQPYEQVFAETTGPEGVVLRLMSALFEPGTDPEELRELFRDDVADEQGDEKALVQTLAEMRALLRQEGVSPGVVLDLEFGALTFDVEGDDRTGYRIRGSSPDGKSLDAMFVVKQRGEYRIQGSWTVPSGVGHEALERAGRGDLEGARRWLGWAADELPPVAPETADPLAVSPFQLLWRDAEEADRSRIRLAAAALAAPHRGMLAAPILEKARKGELSAGEAIAVDRALSVAYASADEHEPALEAARRLAAAVPDHPLPVRRQIYALMELDRQDEAMELAEQLAVRFARDESAVRMVAAVAEAQGDPERAIRVLREMDAAGLAGPRSLNQLAWFLLFVDPGSGEAVEIATRATTGSPTLESATMHTLATVLAEQGRIQEAREVLVLALDQLDSAEELPDVWWYVIGRMAEEYALDQVAIDAYERVPDSEGSLTTSVLARRRLAGLGGD